MGDEKKGVKRADSPIKESGKRSALESVVAEYKGKEGNLIPVLQKAQGIFGYLPPEVVFFLSEKLDISSSRIYGVISFYAQFHTEPRGKYIIRMCRGTACHVRGGKEVVDAFEELLGIKDGETTADMKFAFETVACLGTCALAPVALINDTYYGKLTPEKVGNIIDRYKT
ncbi:MAG: NADH-quinone oxidoreductase subunit NuoE [bacterium]